MPVSVTVCPAGRSAEGATSALDIVARTVGERLIDIQASTEMAQRLMALQRQHLAGHSRQVAQHQVHRLLARRHDHFGRATTQFTAPRL